MNALTLTTPCYLTTLVGTQITRESTQDEWETYGEILRRVEEAKQWAIGDWLVDGKRHYGDGLYKRAAEITGLSESALQTYKSMADSFELCLRKQELGYSHHKEVASIKLIQEDEDGKLSLSKEADTDLIAKFLEEGGLFFRWLGGIIRSAV